MTFIYFILILGITVLIHEFGHFLVAKLTNVYVYEFSIGMGPRLFMKKGKETEYSIRLFPIGGYVNLAGEDEPDKNIPKDRQLINKRWIVRFLTLIAGVTFNIFLAVVILTVIALITGSLNNNTIIKKIDENFPIYQENINVDDEIVKVNDIKTNSRDMLALSLEIFKGEEINVTLKDKNGNFKEVKLKPTLQENNGSKSYIYGFSLDSKINYGIVNSIKYGFSKTFSISNQMIHTLYYLITGRLSIDNLSGPVGVYKVVGVAKDSGLLNVMYLLAYICINVAIVNIIPIPAFDGGRILFLIIEKIKGSPVNSKTESIIHSIGFIFILLLMIIITFNDIIRLFH